MSSPRAGSHRRNLSIAPPSKRQRAGSEPHIDFHARRVEYDARLQSVWDTLAAKYVRDIDEDDIIDIRTQKIVQDRGVLRGLKGNHAIGFSEELEKDEGAESISETEEDNADESDALDDEHRGLDLGEVVRKAVPPLEVRNPVDARELAEFLKADRDVRAARHVLYGSDAGIEEGIVSYGEDEPQGLATPPPRSSSVGPTEDEDSDEEWNPYEPDQVVSVQPSSSSKATPKPRPVSPPRAMPTSSVSTPKAKAKPHAQATSSRVTPKPQAHASASRLPPIAKLELRSKTPAKARQRSRSPKSVVRARVHVELSRPSPPFTSPSLEPRSSPSVERSSSSVLRSPTPQSEYAEVSIVEDFLSISEDERLRPEPQRPFSPTIDLSKVRLYKATPKTKSGLSSAVGMSPEPVEAIPPPRKKPIGKASSASSSGSKKTVSRAARPKAEPAMLSTPRRSRSHSEEVPETPQRSESNSTSMRKGKMRAFSPHFSPSPLPNSSSPPIPLPPRKTIKRKRASSGPSSPTLERRSKPLFSESSDSQSDTHLPPINYPHAPRGHYGSYRPPRPDPHSRESIEPQVQFILGQAMHHLSSLGVSYGIPAGMYGQPDPRQGGYPPPPPFPPVHGYHHLPPPWGGPIPFPSSSPSFSGPSFTSSSSSSSSRGLHRDYSNDSLPRSSPLPPSSSWSSSPAPTPQRGRHQQRSPSNSPPRERRKSLVRKGHSRGRRVSFHLERTEVRHEPESEPEEEEEIVPDSEPEEEAVEDDEEPPRPPRRGRTPGPASPSPPPTVRKRGRPPKSVKKGG